jgi:outer membrane protein assembly factor BamD
MYAYSLYVASPAPNLDQKNSVEAMDAMQTFLNQYPQSKFRDKSVEVITDCQLKLEKKGFENAKQYLKIKSYKAAVIAFDNFKKSFPDSKYLEETAYLKVVAEYKLALQSFQHIQLERYNFVVAYYQELVDNFPESQFLKEAEKMYSDSLNQINKLKNKNT